MRKLRGDLPHAGSSQSGLNISSRFCAIRELQRQIESFEEELRREYGICLNEGMALCSLGHAGELSSGELGELLALTPSNTSKVLASVESKGLVVRALGAKDRRRMYFSLTEKGHELLQSVNNCERIIANYKF